VGIEIHPPAGLVPLLLALPLLHALRRGNPQARLAVAVEQEHRSLLALTGLDLEPVPRRGRPRTEARRLDLGELPDIRSRPVNGLEGRPLWRAFLAAALDAGLRIEGLPRPPYLLPEGDGDNGGRPPAVLADPRWAEVENPFTSLALWLQGRGEVVELLNGQRQLLEDIPKAVAHLSGRRLLLSTDAAGLCLAAALGVPVLGVATPEEFPRCHQPFLGPHVILVVPHRGAPLPQDAARRAAVELLAVPAEVPGRLQVVA
jgi:hypothetical protein